MSTAPFPLLEVTLLSPILGSAWVARARTPGIARHRCLIVALFTLILTAGNWLLTWNRWPFLPPDAIAFRSLAPPEAWFVLDGLSAPLLPLTALLYFVTCLGTMRTKARRFSFAAMLISESLALALLCTHANWGIIALLSAQVVPVYWELQNRGRGNRNAGSPSRSSRRKVTAIFTRVFLIHMGVSVACLVVGQWLVGTSMDSAPHWIGIALLLMGVMIRGGCVPFHCWMTDLFERATFGTALLFITPMAGAYAAMHLILPQAPDWALRCMDLTALITAAYAAGMALVQRDARRWFCYLLLSHSSLVLVGMELVTPIGLTGALCLWLSILVALGGLGLTLRSLEARVGRLSLTRYHGLYEHMPTLAGLFLLTGLASVGFPGTIGFVGTELLLEGAVDSYPHLGIAVVFSTALNGITIIQAYFRLFTGSRHVTSISLGIQRPERIAVLILTLLIIGGGLWPQPGVSSRFRAAQEVIQQRQQFTQHLALESR